MATVRREAPSNAVDPNARWQPCSVHGQNWNRSCVECGDQAVAHLADTLAGKLAIADRANAWKDQCILDLADGRHAVSCGCHVAFYQQTAMMSTTWTEQHRNPPNACLTISRCARDLIGYDVQIEGDKNAEA